MRTRLPQACWISAVTKRPTVPQTNNTLAGTQTSTEEPITLSREDGKVAVETGTATQTDLSAEMVGQMSGELNRLTQENRALRSSLQAGLMNEETFAGDDKRVHFYTGLPSFAALMLLFSVVSDHINYTALSSLTKFQQLVLILMKLRLNVRQQDLAYRFNVSVSTVSRVFSALIDVLHERLDSLVIWPEREDLRKSMPMEFRRHFGHRVAAIVDCFEIFVDRPTNLEARSSTWSNCKHHNTIQFLIGIAPQGHISFISKAWGGRVSDKYITENSGFLNNLLPGDLILADRGFDISESVGLMCAEVNIPAFMNGKKQLSMKEVINTRKIANVRIHVERVIGCIRQRFSILGGPIPTDFIRTSACGKMALIDKIVLVCCAINNICGTVVPHD